jgi:ADP-ribose pyrophosphatase
MQKGPDIMTTLVDYLTFAQAHPTLFTNPPESGFAVLLDEGEIHAAEQQAEQRLVAMGLPAEWARVGIVFRDQYLLVLRDAVRFTDKTLGTYIRIVKDERTSPGVIVLPVYQKQVLLLRHFRHATRAWHLEVPRGFGTVGFSSEENAHRELEEEIEASIERVVPLGPVYPDAGMTAERDELFYADVSAYGKEEEMEAIAAIMPTPIAEFERMIRENEITDGFTLAAYARAKLKGLL